MKLELLTLALVLGSSSLDSQAWAGTRVMTLPESPVYVSDREGAPVQGAYVTVTFEATQFSSTVNCLVSRWDGDYSCQKSMDHKSLLLMTGMDGQVIVPELELNYRRGKNITLSMDSGIHQRLELDFNSRFSEGRKIKCDFRTVGSCTTVQGGETAEIKGKEAVLHAAQQGFRCKLKDSLAEIEAARQRASDQCLANVRHYEERHQRRYPWDISH